MTKSDCYIYGLDQYRLKNQWFLVASSILTGSINFHRKHYEDRFWVINYLTNLCYQIHAYQEKKSRVPLISF